MPLHTSVSVTALLKKSVPTTAIVPLVDAPLTMNCPVTPGAKVFGLVVSVIGEDVAADLSNVVNVLSVVIVGLS